MSAIVHHGGSGTTAAALRSGVPSVVIPLGFDQPYWANRVAALGVSPPSIHRRALTAENLTAALRRALDDTAVRMRATAIGGALRAERGVDVAVQALQEIGR